MDEVTQRTLERLRAAGEGHLTRLVDLQVDRLLERSLESVLQPSRAARHAVELLAAHTKDASHAALALRVEAQARREVAQLARLEAGVPPEAVRFARELATRGYAPEKSMVLAVIDREPMRKQLKELLTTTLEEFGRKLRAGGDSTASKGLSALGALAGAVKKSSSTLGALTNAVSDEVERQLQKRTAEFVDTTMTTVLQRIADGISDPRRATEQAALRSALLDGLLELEGKRVSRELERFDAPAVVALGRKHLADFAARPDASAFLEGRLRALLSEELPKTLGALLEEAGVRDVVRAQLREALEAELREAVATDSFAQWLEALLAP